MNPSFDGDSIQDGPPIDAAAALFDSPELHQFASLSIEEIARTAGLRHIHVVAWRDFDDDESGGSELHAHRILSAWAEAGITVSMTTSTSPGRPPFVSRGGYQVTRRVGRYSIFPRTMISGWKGTLGRVDGLVEIWNGMPFLSPLWARSPRMVFLHHVHGEMWKMVLPRGLAELGDTFEHRIAPLCYRGTKIVTLSSSSKAEIVSKLGLPSANVSVSPPGIEAKFAPGGSRSVTPMVVAVGRLVPVKRFDVLIEGLVALKRRQPELQAVIAGDGYERGNLERLVRGHGAESWLSLPGHVTDEELIDLYRSAWVVTSASMREGWGMTVTEAGACGTPAVVSRISGHLDAVVSGWSGLFFDDVPGMVGALDAVLGDEVLRKHLSAGALEFSRRFSWDHAARGALAVLGAEALRRRGPPPVGA